MGLLSTLKLILYLKQSAGPDKPPMFMTPVDMQIYRIKPNKTGF